MEAYNGTTDPNNHINMFLFLLVIQNLKDVFLCRAFPSTLKGTPYRWFVDLPLGSIISFADLTLKFVTQNIKNIHICKSTNSLNEVMIEGLQRFTKGLHRPEFTKGPLK